MHALVIDRGNQFRAELVKYTLYVAPSINESPEWQKFRGWTWKRLESFAIRFPGRAADVRAAESRATPQAEPADGRRCEGEPRGEEKNGRRRSVQWVARAQCRNFNI